MARNTNLWSPADDALLRAQYPTAPALDKLAKRLGRSEGSIRQRAHKLHLSREVIAPTKPLAFAAWRTPVLAPGQPTRQDGEQLSQQWRTRDLQQATIPELRHLIDVFGRLHPDDVGLWEGLLLKQARQEHARRRERRGRGRPATRARP